MTPKIADIQRRVSAYYGVDCFFMRSPHRFRTVARPRQVAMFLARRLTAQSFPIIGREFGGRDHSTVMHAVKTIERLRASDPRMDHAIAVIEQHFGADQC